MKNLKIGFIGTGNIAVAIVGGIIKSGYIKSGDIYMYDIFPEKVDNLSKYGINKCLSSNELTKICDYVFLTVKPQIYSDVLSEIKNSVSESTCLVSVAAGITIEFVKSNIGIDCKVIRAMPNTPLMYGNGASALVKVDPVTDSEFDFVKGIFDSCGLTCVVEEGLIDTITGISGSSPAFIFRFAKNIINAGINNGLDEHTAKNMVVQTLIGSAKMILESETSIDQLIKMVTSPNGTTEAGLKSLDKDDFDRTVYNCVQASINRSIELKQ